MKIILNSWWCSKSARHLFGIRIAILISPLWNFKFNYLHIKTSTPLNIDVVPRLSTPAFKLTSEKTSGTPRAGAAQGSTVHLQKARLYSRNFSGFLWNLIRRRLLAKIKTTNAHGQTMKNLSSYVLEPTVEKKTRLWRPAERYEGVKHEAKGPRMNWSLEVNCAFFYCTLNGLFFLQNWLRGYDGKAPAVSGYSENTQMDLFRIDIS